MLCCCTAGSQIIELCRWFCVLPCPVSLRGRSPSLGGSRWLRWSMAGCAFDRGPAQLGCGDSEWTTRVEESKRSSGPCPGRANRQPASNISKTIHNIAHPNLFSGVREMEIHQSRGLGSQTWRLPDSGRCLASMSKRQGTIRHHHFQQKTSPSNRVFS